VKLIRTADAVRLFSFLPPVNFFVFLIVPGIPVVELG
jgi:hypothetical protein